MVFEDGSILCIENFDKIKPYEKVLNNEDIE
jgi:hypothetical protein